MFKTAIIGAIITVSTIYASVLIEQEQEVEQAKQAMEQTKESASLYTEAEYGDLTEAERGLCDYILYKGSSEDTTMEELVSQARANSLVCHWEY
tara:strand:+ start:1284 stop:1565 length:282 start_codon:yes stop_codon:yes gene_type:complete